jgi:hypothetical protein
VSAAPRPPVFVGGTGRCGTTILGGLLGSHPDYVAIPVEARFHASQDGLPGVLRGTVAPEAFARRMREHWYARPGRPKLSTFVERDALDAALARFLERAPHDPLAAARGLIEELLGGYARAMGRHGWVEMTPINSIWGAPALARLYPQMRMVNVVRDGRDVAGSLIGIGWLTDVSEALRWWEVRIGQAHRLCRALPEGSLHSIAFERLARDDRAGALRELCDFLDWPAQAAMERFMEERMRPEDAHIGRWETGLSAAQRAFLAEEYPAALARLNDAGVRLPPGADASAPGDRGVRTVSGGEATPTVCVP